MISKILYPKYIHTSLFLLLSFLCVASVSAQDPQSNKNNSFSDPSIAVSLSSFVNLFPSVNGAFEFNYSEMESLEFELGYIYKSTFIEGARGGIFKTSWKRTYKQKATSRYYIGLQQQFQADFITGEAIYFANDFSHYRFDKFDRYKYRFSVLGLVGRDIPIFNWLHISLNMNVGLQTLFVQIKTPDVIDESYEPVQLGSLIILNDHIPIMPDGGVSVQLRFKL